jgi:hypothetical protein
MANEIFMRNLESVRSKCVIRDPEYWEITFKDNEMPMETDSGRFSGDATKLFIRTKDDYQIVIRPFLIANYRACFNGYVSIPIDSPLMEWVREHPSYDDMNYEVDTGVELTYFDLNERQFGWDHAHGHDADLLKSRASQANLIISGPVQVLDEARNLIEAFKEKERMLLMEKKHAEMEVIREELMMKACHPRRVATWTEQGFDPFE